MTDDDRASYRRQFEAAEKRLPRGHVIHHAEWRDGHLTTLSRPAERVREHAEFQPRVKRGVQAGLFD